MGVFNPPTAQKPRRGMGHERSTELDAAEETALVAQLGSEVAATLSKALERVNLLAVTGRIDRAGLRALRAEIEHARQVGIKGQQVCHVASGRVRQADERLDLAALLRQSLQQRGAEMEMRGVEVRQVLRPAEVNGDATLTFSLLQTLLDWAFEHACDRIDLQLDHQSWPAHARLTCSFAYRPADEVHSEAMPLETPTLATIAWRLLQQTARLMGLPVTRDEQGGRTRVTIGFPRTAVDAIEGVSAVDLAAGEAAAGPVTQPLAGSQVLVLSARRELRNLVREALRPMGLMIDFVTSVDEAREYCSGGLPHAIIHEAALNGEAFERLRRNALDEAPDLSFIQITDDDKAFEVRRIGDREIASVGRAAIMESLPAALLFELGRIN